MRRPPPPPPPPPPVIFASGSFELVPSFQVNLDTGVIGIPGADLFYQSVGFTSVQLTPVNGAQISFAGGAQRNQAGCAAAAYSPAPVPFASLAVGFYLCVRTNEGRFSEIRINNIGLILRILSVSFTTWN